MSIYKYILCVSLCFVSKIGYCQINGLIYDSITHKGIPYSMITDIDTLWSVCANSNGVFCVGQQYLIQCKGLIISAHGYETKKILQPISLEKIELEHSSKDSLNFKSGKAIITVNKTKNLGIPKVRLINPVFGSKVYESTEIALFIENKSGKRGIIQNVSFFLTNLGVLNAPFRLRFYKNNRSVIDDNLIVDNIILTGYKKDDWNSFNLSEYKIDFPKEGCFVAVEWMNIDCSKYHYKLNDNSDGLGMTIGVTDSFPNFISYKRYNQKPWKKIGYIFWNGFRLFNYHPMINVDVLF